MAEPQLQRSAIFVETTSHEESPSSVGAAHQDVQTSQPVRIRRAFNMPPRWGLGIFCAGRFYKYGALTELPWSGTGRNQNHLGAEPF